MLSMHYFQVMMMVVD
uniref:Uncharacterized protein n=1 Tax=Anguilla anguilla TaxID=7936 RepID=A0A0E9SKU1_ANGAN